MKRILFVLLIGITSPQTVSAQQHRKADSLLAACKAAPDDTNKVLLLAETSLEYSKTNLDSSRVFATQALELAEKLEYTYGQLKANNLIGRSYALQNNIPQALRYYNTALTIARSQNNPARIAAMAVAIGAIYTQNADWDKANEYLTIAREAFEKAGMPYPNSLCINMGYYHSARKQYIEAIAWYKKAVENEEKKPAPTPDLAQLYGNIGGEMIRTAQLDEALSYLYKALAINTAMGNEKSIAFNLSGIGAAYATAYVNRNTLPDSMQDGSKLLAKAEHYLLQALQLNNRLGIQDNKVDIYNWLSVVAEKKQDYKNAYLYYVAYERLKDSIAGVDVQKEIAHAEAEFRVQKTTDSLQYAAALMDREVSVHKLQRNGAIALVLMAGITGVLFVNRQKLKHRSKLMAAENKRALAEEMARKQLEDFARSMQEKNKLIEEFTSEIKKYRPATPASATEESYVDTLKQSVLLTDAQWSEFQVLFDKVHPGYISRVRERFGDITAAEMRFILLTKLGLSSRDMANMLGVTPDAVRVSKYRLLKKIQLPDGTNPEEYFSTL